MIIKITLCLHRSREIHYVVEVNVSKTVAISKISSCAKTILLLHMHTLTFYNTYIYIYIYIYMICLFVIIDSWISEQSVCICPTWFKADMLYGCCQPGHFNLVSSHVFIICFISDTNACGNSSLVCGPNANCSISNGNYSCSCWEGYNITNTNETNNSSNPCTGVIHLFALLSFSFNLLKT